MRDVTSKLFRTAWIGACTVALAVIALLVPQQAFATDYGYQVVGTGGIGVCQRVSPQLGAARAGCISEGAWVTVNCWVHGEMVTDTWQGHTISWDRWARTPAGLYIADIYLSSSNGSYPECGSAPPADTRETRAVAYAQSQLGVVYTSETSDGMWSGWCELFVERAYGTSGQYARAIYDFNSQQSAGRIHTDTNPPAGALVFYSWADFGHVGISLGGGQVISTQGTTTPLPVRQHSVTGIGLTYLGWSAAPTGWPGR